MCGTRVCVCKNARSLVSYRVLDYPMGALIEPKAHLILRRGEGQIEGNKRGEQSRADKQDREGTTSSAQLLTWVSAADICKQLDLNFALHKGTSVCLLCISVCLSVCLPCSFRVRDIHLSLRFSLCFVTVSYVLECKFVWLESCLTEIYMQFTH